MHKTEAGVAWPILVKQRDEDKYLDIISILFCYMFEYKLVPTYSVTFFFFA